MNINVEIIAFIFFIYSLNTKEIIKIKILMNYIDTK